MPGSGRGGRKTCWNGGRLAASLVLALGGPLPLPHVDTYLPLALGLFAAALALPRDGPTYLFLMLGVLALYVAAVFGLLSLVAALRRRCDRSNA